VRDLLNDLAATDLGAQPPGRCRGRIGPTRRDEAGRVGRQSGADLGQLFERAQVIAHGRDQAAIAYSVGDPMWALGVASGQRLLGQERDSAGDDRLAGSDRSGRRDRHVGDVGPLLVEHPLVVVVGRGATRARGRLGARQAG
jgi:hypothetical protein